MSWSSHGMEKVIEYNLGADADEDALCSHGPNGEALKAFTDVLLPILQRKSTECRRP
jgi:hypothetical protein